MEMIVGGRARSVFFAIDFAAEGGCDSRKWKSAVKQALSAGRKRGGAGEAANEGWEQYELLCGLAGGGDAVGGRANVLRYAS